MSDIKDGKCKCDLELEKYKIHLEFLKFEATILWQIFNAFFIANAVFIGFIATSFNEAGKSFILLFWAGVAGLILSLLWLITFSGNSKWYYFRMKQTKDAEKKFTDCINDDKWYLLNKEAETFSKTISSVSNKYAGYLMILLFIVIYIAIIFGTFCNAFCII